MKKTIFTAFILTVTLSGCASLGPGPMDAADNIFHSPQGPARAPVAQAPVKRRYVSRSELAPGGSDPDGFGFGNDTGDSSEFGKALGAAILKGVVQGVAQGAVGGLTRRSYRTTYRYDRYGLLKSSDSSYARSRIHRNRDGSIRRIDTKLKY